MLDRHFNSPGISVSDYVSPHKPCSPLLDKLPLPIIDNSGIPETCSLQHHQVRRRDVANGKNKVEVALAVRMRSTGIFVMSRVP